MVCRGVQDASSGRNFARSLERAYPTPAAMTTGMVVITDYLDATCTDMVLA